MPRNIEIKARVDGHFEELVEKARAIATSGPEVILQEDTFYRCSTGRLKLRRFSESVGVLIAYDRPDTAEPKASRYRLAHTAVPDALHEVLLHSLGERGRVRTRRMLFLAGRTRIHLDEVEGLGRFVELEVVLDEGQSEEEGQEVARDLMARLGIAVESLVERAYVDLLAEQGGTDKEAGKVSGVDQAQIPYLVGKPVAKNPADRRERFGIGSVDEVEDEILQAGIRHLLKMGFSITGIESIISLVRIGSPTVPSDSEVGRFILKEFAGKNPEDLIRPGMSVADLVRGRY